MTIGVMSAHAFQFQRFPNGLLIHRVRLATYRLVKIKPIVQIRVLLIRSFLADTGTALLKDAFEQNYAMER